MEVIQLGYIDPNISVGQTRDWCLVDQRGLSM